MVAVLIVAGLHVPVIPFVELVGNNGPVEFRQSSPIWVNAGATFGVTVIVKVAVVAHWPAAGVNVYVVVAVLFKAGAHVPVIPLVDVVGDGDNTVPEQTAATAVNVGVIWLVITISIVTGAAH